MKKLELLSSDDFIDLNYLPDLNTYGLRSSPKASDRNFQILIDKVNELIEVVNQLIKDKE